MNAWAFLFMKNTQKNKHFYDQDDLVAQNIAKMSYQNM